MGFDRALGHVQIAGDFRVVASLEQQFDDLPFAASHLYEIFFHKNTHLIDAPPSRQVARKPGPSAHLDSSLFASFCIHAAKSPPRMLTKIENLGSRA